MLGYDRFAVPGQLAAEYVRQYAPDRPIYALPNTVRETVFRDSVASNRAIRSEIRSALGIPAMRRLLLLTGRLAREKGIEEFLSAIAGSRVAGDFTFLIAGDGSLREKLSSWIAQHEQLDVRLVGHLPEYEMARLYAAADCFVLPSLADPNPLAVIEALWAGLPIMLSNRVGNYPEALVPGENGWLLDPLDPTGVAKAVEEWHAAPAATIEAYGKASARIAGENFDTQRAVSRFLEDVLGPS
ncbi:MAG: glycosyltransferase family 4 protein [Blastocatellia bacterium]